MNKSTKKNIIILTIAALLIVITIVVLLARRTTTFDYDSNQFAVKDTNEITKIFIADNYGKSVLLERQVNGEWKVNKEFIAIKRM